MKLENLFIEKLHGIYNYDVDFNEDITFLYGSNGCGKTTIPKKGQRRVMKTFSHNTLESTLYFDTNEAEIWRNDISQLNNYQSSLRHSGITLSIEVPLLLVTGAAVGAGLSEAATMSKVTGWLSFFGTGAGIMGDDNPISVTRTLISYYKMDQKMIHDGERCYFAEGPV
ncbi:MULTISPECIES: hypothetical protein [Lactococcus]|uniref:hypothetical protein n=1 Tax=Lactococcus garvieae TaxID=1363 RepID=UPI003851CD2F